ncbi:hypothetical protein BSL82_06790 [Tardibacter chloracetimidivorans]|uniref:PhnB-like domain-containing protein n=1 Tax=Tardibacter chloracetimidivorans TaxID=1921510 RepID=A0A1L3ZTY4_9SPHN|nr:VOC family protein [Tardibacter chloracetimidivorans]API59050.1 hypothetical protein BSL82_06790 [Tardibacter chloracetimidivorans]
MAVIGTCLWFNDQAEEAARFYTGIFPNSSVGDTSYYPEGTPAPFPPGSVMIVEFTLDGRPFMGLNGGPQFPFSEAISMTVDCADQAEIDHYWDALLADGGQPGPCGWLKDRFGVSWQVFPRALIQMHKTGTPEQANRATAAMMKMSKLDVATLEAAFAGENE